MRKQIGVGSTTAIVEAEDGLPPAIASAVSEALESFVPLLELFHRLNPTEQVTGGVRQDGFSVTVESGVMGRDAAEAYAKLIANAISKQYADGLLRDVGRLLEQSLELLIPVVCDGMLPFLVAAILRRSGSQ